MKEAFNTLFNTVLTIILLAGLLKAGLWYFDVSEGFVKWQKPLCLVHDVSQWNCQEYLQEFEEERQSRSQEGIGN